MARPAARRRSFGPLCRLMPIILPALTVAACEDSLYEVHRAKSLADAGTYHIAVTAAIPFDDISAELSPTFKLSGDDAVGKVIPTTTYFEERLLQAFSAAVGVGLPTTTTSGNLTTNLANGQFTTTGTQTTNVNPGTAPKPDAAPGGLDAGIKSGATLNTGDDKRKTAKDPILEYNLATALYQEVALLQAYTKYVEQRKGMTAYILRLNVSIQPKALNQPYDAYVDIGFFNFEREGAKPPFVVPLLVTDNLEGTSSARSAETIVQIATAITAVAHGAGISGNFGSTRDHLRSILGTDLNSTLTVSRSLDNVVKVRLGAPRQPTAGYAMIPRNHVISVLVLADVDKTSLHDAGRGLQVLTKTTLRDAENGVLLPYNERDVFTPARATLHRIFDRYPKQTLNDERQLDQAIRTLVALAQTHRVVDFKNQLGAYGGKDWADRWEEAWVGLSEASVSSEFQGTSIVLPIAGTHPKATVRAVPNKPAPPAAHKASEPAPPATGAITTTTTTKTTTTKKTTIETPAASPSDKGDEKKAGEQ